MNDKISDAIFDLSMLVIALMLIILAVLKSA